MNSKMYANKAMVALFLCTILISTCKFTYASNISSKIGVNYGRLGTNLPSPYRSIKLLESMNVGRIKLYDANPEVLKLLSGTKLDVSIMVTNEQLSGIASSQSDAENWVQENVLAYYPSTRIRFILVGNEVLSDSDRKMWLDLVPAMRNIKKSLKGHDIHNIKVGTPLAMDTFESTFPPSSGRFRSDIPNQVVVQLLKFLNGTRSFLFLDVYPYFPWSSNPTNVNLDYALLEGGNVTFVDSESGLVYTNLLDQMLDSVVFAMRKFGFDNIMMAVSETGWPNEGDIDQVGANTYNAATYNRNLVKKMTADPPLGTPAKPGFVIPTFIFSLYDENLKPGPGTERHWGLINPSGQPIYEIDLTGKHPENEQTRLSSAPSNNSPYKGKIWCVVASQPNLTDLETALDFTCSQGNGTCDALAPGKACYEPVSVTAHANFAFSSYWSKFRSSGASCYFNGLAVQTTTDPSHGSCQFPSVSL